MTLTPNELAVIRECEELVREGVLLEGEPEDVTWPMPFRPRPVWRQCRIHDAAPAPSESTESLLELLRETA